MAGTAQQMEFEQPASFTFTPENMAEIEKVVAKYPKGKQASAVMPLLWLAQKQHGGWIPEKAMEEIGRLLDMPRIKVFEVATFYTMYNLKPVGKHLIQCCTTTPCWLRGSAEIVKACEDKLGIKMGETTKDGQFTMVEVECLGACCNAPMVQINDDFYEDLTPQSITAILDGLSRGEKPKAGSQTGRTCSMSEKGVTSLLEEAKAKGVAIAGEGR
jgi:NADH-quinone oxidoreductase subunit E